MQRANDKHKSVGVEVVDDETLHAYQELRDVAMEEVEDVHAHDSDGFDDEMENYNFADTENVGERGGGAQNTHEALGELLMPQARSQTPKNSPPHSIFVLDYEIAITYAPNLAFLHPHLHLMHLMWQRILYTTNIRKTRFWRLLRQCLNIFDLNMPLSLPPARQVVGGPLSRLSTTLEGTRSTHGNMKDKKPRT